MRVCLWEEIYNTWKDLTAKSCSYVCFPFEEPETKDTAFFHFCTQCSTLVCIHSFVHLWLMTNLNPWHMCWETFQGFFLRGGKTPWNPQLMSTLIQKVQNHELAKKLIDSQKFENSPRLVCAIFSLFSLPQQLFQESFQRSKSNTCHSANPLSDSMKWCDQGDCLLSMHYSGRYTTMRGVFCCNSWNLLNTWRWYILGCWKMLKASTLGEPPLATLLDTSKKKLLVLVPDIWVISPCELPGGISGAQMEVEAGGVKRWRCKLVWMDQLMENLSNKNLEVLTWGSLRIDHWKRFGESPVSWSLPWGCAMPIFTGKAWGWGYDR